MLGSRFKRHHRILSFVFINVIWLLVLCTETYLREHLNFCLLTKLEQQSNPILHTDVCAILWTMVEKDIYVENFAQLLNKLWFKRETP